MTQAKSRVVSQVVLVLFPMSKQLTLFKYCSDTTKNRRTLGEQSSGSSEGNVRSEPSDTASHGTRILQKNTVFVDNPTSSTTTIIINDRCSLGFESFDAEDGLER